MWKQFTPINLLSIHRLLGFPLVRLTFLQQVLILTQIWHSQPPAMTFDRFEVSVEA